MENHTPSQACPMCDGGTLQARSDRRFSFRYLRRLHHIEGLEHAICDRCGTSSFLPGQMERNKARIEEFQRSLAGYIGPQDIRALRERYGLTQELAAKIFGGGVHAFSKWERGQVKPAGPTAKLMRLALNDPAAMHNLVSMAGLDAAAEDFAGLRSAEQEQIDYLAGMIAQRLRERWIPTSQRTRKIVVESVGGEPSGARALKYQVLARHGQCVKLTWDAAQMNDEISDAIERAAA